MAALRLILADQLSESISALADLDRARDTVLLCEVMEEATYVAHHPKKIAFLFAAMRHFADALRANGVRVHYSTLDDADNCGSFDGEVARVAAAMGAERIIVTEPGEWRVREKFRAWPDALGLPVEIRVDDRFFCSTHQFAQWAGSKRQLRMEHFYRTMRREHGVLMRDDGTPEGGRWNFDRENRKPPLKGLRGPKRIAHPRSAHVRDVLALVHARFGKHFGDLEPFYFAVTRAQALEELEHFIAVLLPHFGDHQDAMVMDEPYLYHSLLSSYINAGLLLPREVVQRAEAAYRNGQVPLASVEGFIRQILGWREFMRGVYWRDMPAYASSNALHASRKLPAFYWGAPTQMRCLREAVKHTREHAYSHHIQRLMVTGNFALLAGLAPDAVCQWYLEVYADAYEWVEITNTRGMALFADGGTVGSKPYAASGHYMDRMSNFCGQCRFDPKQTLGDDACPFNALYWDFMVRHEALLRDNQRLPYVYANWARMGAAKQQAIRAKAQALFAQLEQDAL